ncbi:MAG: NAD-dependent deacylase [Pseudomonadota bacterium]
MSRWKNIVVLTGAGVSADSGVATFRDPDGVWAKYDYRDVATPEGFAADPMLVHSFYNSRRAGLANVEPNPAHYALVALESALKERDGALTLVTQNVDDLHERAGSKAVLKMHGALREARCGPGPDGVSGCGAVHDWREDLSIETVCPACGLAGAMRPNVVWFGEMPRYMEAIADALAYADLFVSIGTSGSVYPAAGFVHEARAFGVPCTELNLEPSENAAAFSDARYGPAASIVPAWVESVLGTSGGD